MRCGPRRRTARSETRMIAPSGEPRLAGKRVLLTGTGGGQGAEAQKLFCEHGAVVHGCDIREGAAEAVAQSLCERGLQAFGDTVDLADPDAAAAWVERGVAAIGGLDVLYNNASKPRFAPFASMTLDDWRSVMTNELDIVFHVTSPAWRHLIADGGGSVINTASVAGAAAVGRMGQAAHSAAKGAVVALSRQLAAEGAPHGIRVNSISPGFIDTPGTSVVTKEQRDWMVSNLQLLPRVGTAEEVAALALYLASDESAFVTGAEIRIDGGWSAGKP